MDYSEPLMSPFSTRASRNSFARFVSDWISATSSAVEDWAVKLHTSFCWLAPARLTVGVAPWEPSFCVDSSQILTPSGCVCSGRIIIILFTNFYLSFSWKEQSSPVLRH